MRLDLRDPKDLPDDPKRDQSDRSECVDMLRQISTVDGISLEWILDRARDQEGRS